MTTSDAFSPGLSPRGVKGGDPQEGIGGGLPASPPDEAYLTRLANEMFAQAPGGVPSGVNLGGLQPSGLQAGAPSSPSLAVDAPGLGAVGMMSNSNLRPSAHGASIPGMVAPRGVPSAIPLPGETELRALLAPRLSSPAAAQSAPGVDPVNAETLALSGTDAPGAGAVGARSNSNLRPSARGASIPGMAASRGAPAAIPLPGEAELRALLAPRLSSPLAAQPLNGADPATAEALALSGREAPGAGAVGAPNNSNLRPSAHGTPIPGLAASKEAPLTVPPSAGGFSLAAPGSHYYFLDESRLSSPRAIPSAPQSGYDVYAVRRDFPILDQQINGHPLIWLDNAATTQKPQAVIDRLVHFYSFENSNVHRGAHELAARSTDAYEDAREKVRGFLGASSSDEIVFVRGATEAINLVAQSWGRQNIGKDDEIVITWLEHHANIVPWQQLCTESGRGAEGRSRRRSWAGSARCL